MPAQFALRCRETRRYAHCDCAEPTPCSHVPLAIWAFRKLPAEKTAGLVSTQEADAPVPTEALDAAEAVLIELARQGIAHLPAAWKDRMIRLEKGFRAAGLAWPAEIVVELVQHYERYAARDARFDPARVAELAGELLIRCDAIRSGTRAVPQLLVRGSSADRATEIGSARYIGLGCGVLQHRKGVEITAYLQDSDSGSIVAIGRRFSGSAQGVCRPAQGVLAARADANRQAYPAGRDRGGPVVAPGRQALRRPPARAGPRPCFSQSAGICVGSAARAGAGRGF